MKKQALIAALATLASGAALAQSSVTVYGRLNTTIERQKNIGTADTQTVLQNNASRLGFKGSEDLGGGLKADFFLEHRFNVDTGTTTGDFWAGDSWVGLSSSNFGAVRLGRITSPAYYATADYVSLHNHDTGTSEDKFYTYLTDNKNTVSYMTPTFGGFNAEAQVALGEGKREKVYNLAANYDAGPLHLGAGYEKVDDDNQFAIRALYELGAFTFGGYYQRSDIDTPNAASVSPGKRDAFRLSGMYALGASEFHVNVGFAGEWDNIDNSDARQFTLGYNYNLSKRTKVYAFYTKVDNKAGADYFSGVAGRDPSALAVGIRHNF